MFLVAIIRWFRLVLLCAGCIEVVMPAQCDHASILHQLHELREARTADAAMISALRKELAESRQERREWKIQAEHAFLGPTERVLLEQTQQQLSDLKEEIRVVTGINQRRKRRSARVQMTELAGSVAHLRRDVVAIQRLEDQEFTRLLSQLSSQNVTLETLSDATRQLANSLAELMKYAGVSPDNAKAGSNGNGNGQPGNVDGIYYYWPTELERIKGELSELKKTLGSLQNQVFEINDQHKFLHFLVDSNQLEQHNFQTQVDYSMTESDYRLSALEASMERLNESLGGSEDLWKDSPSASSEASGSGDGPSEFLWNSGHTTQSSGATKNRQRLTPKTTLRNLCNCKHFQSFDKLAKNLTILYGNVSRSLKQLSLTDAQFKKEVIVLSTQLNQTRSRLDAFVEHAISREDFISIQKAIRAGENALMLLKNNCSATQVASKTGFDRLSANAAALELRVARAEHIAKVVRTVQEDHFTEIQNFKQDLNEIQTDVLRYGLKLSTLQADFLNSTLYLYRQSNVDLQQDLKLELMKADITQQREQSRDLTQTFKELTGVIQSKVGRSDWKATETKIVAIAEKIDAHGKQLLAMRAGMSGLGSSLMRLENELPHDCGMNNVRAKAAEYRSGMYTIKPENSNVSAIVYCDMDDGEPGWTVIQRRQSGFVSFNKTWAEYRAGFGDVSGDHWLGNNLIHLISRQDKYALRITMRDIFDDWYEVDYGHFTVGAENEQYRLQVGNFSIGAGGNLSDAFTYHSGMKFSTADADYDASSTHCALHYASGWWFTGCHKTNLNGNFAFGMIWFNNQTRDWIQLRSVVMKIRRAK